MNTEALTVYVALRHENTSLCIHHAWAGGGDHFTEVAEGSTLLGIFESPGGARDECIKRASQDVSECQDIVEEALYVEDEDEQGALGVASWTRRFDVLEKGNGDYRCAYWYTVAEQKVHGSISQEPVPWEDL